jgi:cytosine/adenosine deaminase-related metal-dependent hydrolase
MTEATGPIDPASSPSWAIAGRVVTMDRASTVVADGAVWIKDAAIAAITSRGDATPAGFDGIAPVETRGTIFPGLIELHNHIAYNVLPLWQVPKKYTNRDTWGNSEDYHRLVTAPMKTIGEATDLLPALVRYVEAKAQLGGVTTTQGIALFSAAGIRRYYRGIVRNVEETNDPLLPGAGSRIADVAASDPQAFLTEINKKTCFLLHLSEGTDEPAHKHFEASSSRAASGRSRRRWPGSTAWPSNLPILGCSRPAVRRWCGRRSATSSSTARPQTWPTPRPPAAH